MPKLTALFLALTLTLPQTGWAFSTVVDRVTFLHLIEDKKLRQFGIWIRFDEIGHVKGRAWGRPVLGNWYWEGQKLCKRVFHGTTDTGFGCVTVRYGAEVMLFIPEKGEGKIEEYSVE